MPVTGLGYQGGVCLLTLQVLTVITTFCRLCPGFAPGHPNAPCHQPASAPCLCPSSPLTTAVLPPSRIFPSHCRRQDAAQSQHPEDGQQPAEKLHAGARQDAGQRQHPEDGQQPAEKLHAGARQDAGQRQHSEDPQESHFKTR